MQKYALHKFVHGLCWDFFFLPSFLSQHTRPMVCCSLYFVCVCVCSIRGTSCIMRVAYWNYSYSPKWNSFPNTQWVRKKKNLWHSGRGDIDQKGRLHTLYVWYNSNKLFSILINFNVVHSLIFSRPIAFSVSFVQRAIN